MQIYAVGVRVERPTLFPCTLLIFPAYARIARLSLLHVKPVLSSVVPCLPYLRWY